jgi:transposase
MSLFPIEANIEEFKDLGNGLFLRIENLEIPLYHVYKRGQFLYTDKIRNDEDLRLFCVTVIEKMGAQKSKLSEVVSKSRTSVDTWIGSFNKDGVLGLINSTKENVGRKRLSGNKARELESDRREKSEVQDVLQQEIDFENNGKLTGIPLNELPYNEEHGWKATRYAGLILYQVTLISVWGWYKHIAQYFKEGLRMFGIFVLMAGRNIRSIEQLKNIKAREAGLILGIGILPSKPKVWELFYKIAGQKKSIQLKMAMFAKQLRNSLVSRWLWFTDGHCLPYTGHKKVHECYNTKRRMPEPGQTNFVTCDVNGKIIDFEIQEGKGDLRERIKSMHRQWKEELPDGIVHVFDREGHDKIFFAAMVKDNCYFVTWDKNVDQQEMKGIDDSKYIDELELNQKKYGFFEEPKKYLIEEASGNKFEFVLRRVYVWNKSTGYRTCGLSYSPAERMGTKDCAFAILSRWGASENTFKYINKRHPLHYQPGLKFEESQKQEILNPEVKELQKRVAQLKNGLDKLYKKLSKTEKSKNQDNTTRKNSSYQKLKEEIQAKEKSIEGLQEQVKSMPGKVNVKDLEDYRMFSKINNEGKNLFDFVTSSIWNARKQMVEWLSAYYKYDNELIDLFYLITECQGWIKVTKDRVVVRLEPLEQPSRMNAQVEFCNKLSSLNVQTLGGKIISIEVGSPPVN